MPRAARRLCHAGGRRDAPRHQCHGQGPIPRRCLLRRIPPPSDGPCGGQVRWHYAPRRSRSRAGLAARDPRWPRRGAVDRRSAIRVTDRRACRRRSVGRALFCRRAVRGGRRPPYRGDSAGSLRRGRFWAGRQGQRQRCHIRPTDGDSCAARCVVIATGGAQRSCHPPWWVGVGGEFKDAKGRSSRAPPVATQL